jgi:hypothetical protein
VLAFAIFFHVIAQPLGDYRRLEGQDRGTIDVDGMCCHGLPSKASLVVWTGISPLIEWVGGVSAILCTSSVSLYEEACKRASL